VSTNCIRCVKERRTGPDLLCDTCRVDARWRLVAGESAHQQATIEHLNRDIAQLTRERDLLRAEVAAWRMAGDILERASLYIRWHHRYPVAETDYAKAQQEVEVARAAVDAAGIALPDGRVVKTIIESGEGEKAR
jgi:hypothetical protein